MFIGIGWLKGWNYVSDLPHVNGPDYKSYDIGWAKGPALLAALTAQKLLDAMFVVEHWPNLGG